MLGEETPLAASNNPYERIRDGIVAAMQQDTGGCGKCGEVCGRWWHTSSGCIMQKGNTSM